MKANPHASFNRLIETALAYRSSKPLLVALHYDFFTKIEEGRRTPEALASGLGLDARAVGIVLDAVAAAGFLRKSGHRYANTPPARKILVSTSPHYQGNNLKYQEQIWDAWSDLKGVVKSGRPRLSLLDWIHKDVFTEDYVKAMGDVARAPARDLAGKLGLAGVSRTLDVGCGPGVYSAAFVDRNPAIEATLLDLPRTLGVTRRLLAGHRHAGRFRYHPADFLRGGFGESEFDLVLISNVTHVENEANNLKLVEKARRALRPGGRLVLHDYVAEPSRPSSKFVANLAVHLLVFTGRGAVYTRKQYEGWLRKAKFGRIHNKPVATGSVHRSEAVIGHKLNR